MGVTGELGRVERSLERLFRLSVGRSMEARQAAAVGADVTRAGYAILRSLAEAGELNLGEVARECSMDPGAASRQVRQLEDAGYLARGDAQGDARVTVLRLTSQGRAVYTRIVRFRTGHLGRVLAGWSDEDRAQLSHLVDRLVDDLRSVPLPDPEGADRATS